ncbi:TIGR02996 domain-containing protein [Fimbriiglobus ruber]|uniref:TIGR02996 domain-containing protein n=1 Tax=Fimbriiglobus ruber TaxID=1908690 RepID=A0A225EGR7_9BACT|nr:TIGR02996 domain-containing protein [Fimbriiglobus ruber]OWK47505.1 hypothetical protein FRUB_01204 [Fimbriiglobus ruber]
MSDDAAFLAAIRSAPNDNMARLVYADWLDEQGRPGGEFLRVECEIADLDPAEFERREQERVEFHEAGGIDSAPPDTMDTYHWRRGNLVAMLRCTTRGLDDDWMTAVSRVPVEEINARIRGIQAWLRRRMTPAELFARMAEWDQPAKASRGLWQRVRGLFQRNPTPVSQPEGPHVRGMREWVEANLKPGDELWEYNTGGESWAHLCGEMGYAIVRNGKVVEFEMLLMN